MKVKPDRVSALLTVLLMATLIAFFAGVIPYPYGWIVITLLLIFRLAGSANEE